MTTLIRIIITSVISLLVLSCNFSINLGEGIDGNKNVVTEDRTLSEDFNTVKVSQGLDLYITQSNTASLHVEADENLQDIIKTEVEQNVLRIYCTENIRRAASKKIMLSMADLSKLQATSGSEVNSTNTIKVSDLTIDATSGAYITIDVKTKNLSCNTTSGSAITVNGEAKNLTASATSGSAIDARTLKSELAQVKATSGADITVNASQELTARATSGADIKYFGNPKKLDKSDSSAGNVRQQ